MTGRDGLTTQQHPPLFMMTVIMRVNHESGEHQLRGVHLGLAEQLLHSATRRYTLFHSATLRHTPRPRRWTATCRYTSLHPVTHPYILVPLHTSVSPSDIHHCATVTSIVTPPVTATEWMCCAGGTPSAVGSAKEMRWQLSAFEMLVEGSSCVV